MFHKVKKINVIKKYILETTFENDVVKYYDVSQLFEKWKAFENLKTIEGLFDQAKVDKGGYGISWNEDLDIECEELWEHGVDSY